MQIKDMPKTAIAAIWTICIVIDNIHNTKKAQHDAMDVIPDKPWVMLQEYMTNIESKLVTLIDIIEQQVQNIKVIQGR